MRDAIKPNLMQTLEVGETHFANLPTKLSERAVQAKKILVWEHLYFEPC